MRGHFLACISALWLTSVSRYAHASDAAPSPSTPEDFVKGTYDFVIVGGGTSGLVVAARLTENPSIRVGVIEAGEYRPGDPLILVPQSTGPAVLGVNSQNQSNLQGNPVYDWQFLSTPQPGLNGSKVLYPRGKVVGGSSAINTMIWQRASGHDYDLWGSVFGNGAGWSFASLLPYFKKVETWTAPPIRLPGQQVSSALKVDHGTSGPVNISYNNFLTGAEIPAVASANSLGLLTTSNPDGGNVTGFAYMARNVNPTTGFRSYAGSAYYEVNAGRPNLKLVSEALVTKINFIQKSGKLVASGVDFVVGGQTFTASAKREVILAAGSLKTPQVLELSGVGNKTLLQSLGIKTLLDSPQIGENLQDHPVTYSDFKVKPGVITLDSLAFNQSFLTAAHMAFNQSQTGPLSYTEATIGPATLQSIVTPAQFGHLLKTLDSTIKTIKAPTGLQAAQFKAAGQAIKAGNVPWIEFVLAPEGGVVSVPANNTGYVTAVTMLFHAFSRGSVHINSNDPQAAPVINPNFADNAFDTEVLVRGSQFVRKWMAGADMANITDSPNVPDLSIQTDAQFETYVRNHVGSTAHPLGTTAMAPQNLGGVVDNRLKVYGLQNVRIVDASIFPFTLSAAIMSSVFAVAEKAADLIKQDNRI